MQCRVCFLFNFIALFESRLWSDDKLDNKFVFKCCQDRLVWSSACDSFILRADLNFFSKAVFVFLGFDSRHARKENSLIA